ncbi:flagellar biosynthetic protein FliP [Bordetella genomosp. 9]|uniref:Flagellar biosynthetic protein FliP n=2 Tax=Bordetella genomosp. 9 TaxID=1416803 RepID=A0A1W6Z0U3_9BORD|nr:flagellar biosynthetic protein FliP [Bordetella genomosp. 9]
MTRSLGTRRGDAGPMRTAAITLAGLALLALACIPLSASAQATLPALTATPGPNGSETYSLSVQTLLMLTSLTFLPAALLMMTGFTRIIIVLGLMRSALGTQTTPPNLVLIGLALFLTAYTMSPVFDQIYKDAYQPFSEGAISFETAIERGSQPLRTFMLHQTRETDLSLFANLTNQPAMETPAEVPMKVLVPAFVTSELKTAFQIGFTIFIPFLIIDMVVASVLMGLGMMMVPPISVSLPFKLMLFVLADGWHMLLGSLARSFYQ